MRSGHGAAAHHALVRWSNPSSSRVNCGGTCVSRLIALEGIDVNLEVDVAARSARTLYGWCVVGEWFGAEWFQPSLANHSDPRTNSLDLLAAHPPLVDQ